MYDNCKLFYLVTMMYVFLNRMVGRRGPGQPQDRQRRDFVDRRPDHRDDMRGRPDRRDDEFMRRNSPLADRYFSF